MSEVNESKMIGSPNANSADTDGRYKKGEEEASAAATEAATDAPSEAGTKEEGAAGIPAAGADDDDASAPVATPAEPEPDENIGLNKALESYRKLIEKKDGDTPLTEEERESLERKLDEMRDRDVVEKVADHEPVEILCENQKVTVGPPTLTRFEKARIMGARALQLSQGAPPFIPIPKTARTSLDISMEELEQRVIPITIRRVLPNGDHQNIPISYFEK